MPLQSSNTLPFMLCFSGLKASSFSSSLWVHILFSVLCLPFSRPPSVHVHPYCIVCPKQGTVLKFHTACAVWCKKEFQDSCSCQWWCLSHTIVWECGFRFNLYPTMLLPHCLPPSADHFCPMVSLNGPIWTEFWFFSNNLSSFSTMQILSPSTCVVA